MVTKRVICACSSPPPSAGGVTSGLPQRMKVRHLVLQAAATILSHDALSSVQVLCNIHSLKACSVAQDAEALEAGTYLSLPSGPPTRRACSPNIAVYMRSMTYPLRAALRLGAESYKFRQMMYDQLRIPRPALQGPGLSCTHAAALTDAATLEAAVQQLQAHWRLAVAAVSRAQTQIGVCTMCCSGCLRPHGCPQSALRVSRFQYSKVNTSFDTSVQGSQTAATLPQGALACDIQREVMFRRLGSHTGAPVLHGETACGLHVCADLQWYAGC